MPAHDVPTSIRSHGHWLLDDRGRVLTLHGTGLSASKLPIGQASHLPFSDDISYVGRPFPLADADRHLARLREHGLTLLRLVVPWEALEHVGPGLYDDAFIDYMSALLAKLPRYGMRAIVDVHQDCFSRFTGGSGAPRWTLELAGIDVTKLHDCAAAYVHSQCSETDRRRISQLWPTNQTRYGCATMSTLFWVGQTLAPHVTVPRSAHADPSLFADLPGDVNIQIFLQRSLIAAYGRLADALAPISAAIFAWEPQNEPVKGYIDLADPYAWSKTRELHVGVFPGPLDAMALASGYSRQVSHYVQSDLCPPTRCSHKVKLVPPSDGVFKPGYRCPWRGTFWSWDEKRGEPYALDPAFFRDKAHWWSSYLSFARAFAERVHRVEPTWHIALSPLPGEGFDRVDASLLPARSILCPHHYNLPTHWSKSYGNITVDPMPVRERGLSLSMVLKTVYFGNRGARRNFAGQVRKMVDQAHAAYDLPVLFTETGAAMDINRDGKDQSHWQEKQLDAIVSSIEASSCGFTSWAVNHDATDAEGDGWCGESFSYVRDGVENCLDVVARPYAAKIPGRPISTHYDFHTLAFSFSFSNPSAEDLKSTSSVAEVFLPARTYGDQHLIVEVSDGAWHYDDLAQTLYWKIEDMRPDHVHEFSLQVADPPRQAPLDIDLRFDDWLPTALVKTLRHQIEVHRSCSPVQLLLRWFAVQLVLICLLSVLL